MNYYTSIKQSKKLIKLGLSPNTADMYYRTTINGVAMTADKPSVGKRITEWDIPCWSVGALLALQPIGIIGLKNCDGNFRYSYKNFDTNECKNSLDAAYEIVIWLLEHYELNIK